MKTGVEYLRYSSDRQTEQSIEGQKRVCDEFAKRNDIVIVDTYIDRAMPGTNDNREAFQQMLKDSDKKAWDFVLVYKLDRFSRNKYEMAIHRKHLKDNGIKILSAMENIPDTPEGILLESLLEGMNQYYSEELSQKTKRGMNETRLKGNFIGGIPNYGYSLKEITADVNGKQVRTALKVIINEEEAPILKAIFTDYSNGKRICDIVKELTERGVLNRGKPFLAGTIYSLLQQEKYTGIYRLNGAVYDKIYPQIIPPELYEIVRKRIDANKYGKHVPGIDYLLKGRIFCGYCGNPMNSYTGTSCTGKINQQSHLQHHERNRGGYLYGNHQSPIAGAGNIPQRTRREDPYRRHEDEGSAASGRYRKISERGDQTQTKIHDRTAGGESHCLYGQGGSIPEILSRQQ